jgi:hypothetical protein
MVIQNGLSVIERKSELIEMRVRVNRKIEEFIFIILGLDYWIDFYIIYNYI